MLRRLSHRRLRRPRLVLFAAALLGAVLYGSPAEAHNTCLTQEAYGSPDCAAHWANFHTNYHFSGEITQAHHQGMRDRFVSGVNTWTAATNPNSPWHVHVNSGAPNHVGTVNMTLAGAAGFGRILQEDGNNHTPRIEALCQFVEDDPCDIQLGLWLRHDIWENSVCGAAFNQTCSWYTGTGTGGATTVDAWGIWVEEIGHIQNISHHIPPSHSTAHGHAMDGGNCTGTVDDCSRDKRSRALTSHEKTHACEGYRATHNNC